MTSQHPTLERSFMRDVPSLSLLSIKWKYYKDLKYESIIKWKEPVSLLLLLLLLLSHFSRV